MTQTETVSFRQFFKQHAAQETAPFLSVASGHLVAKPEEDEHATWTMECLPKDEVAFKGHGNLYISVTKNGLVHLTKERNHDSHFHLVREEVEHPGCVAIKDSHGGFLSIETNGHVIQKKHLSELDDPARLPYFKFIEHKTASKNHHGHAHGHSHHCKDHL